MNAPRLGLTLALALAIDPHDRGCTCPECEGEPDARDAVAERDDDERAAALYAREHSAARLG